MAKKRKELTEEEKHLKMMDKCSPFYEAFKDELNLEGDEIGQIHQLVKAGCELQCQICTEADKINIDGFEKAQDISTLSFPASAPYSLYSVQPLLFRLFYPYP